MSEIQKAIHGAREAPVADRSSMQTVLLSIDEIEKLVVPPFQRPLRVNDKVTSIADELKQNGGCVTGVITLGKLRGSTAIYIVDGLHRREAVRISGLPEVIADIRVMTFDSMRDMAIEFYKLNSSIVKMRPDDILRSLEYSQPLLVQIRQRCEFVGYDNVRRRAQSAILSMSTVLRAWNASAADVPAMGGPAVVLMAERLEEHEVQNMINFLHTAHAAWGRDQEYYRLWATLNLTMCMWMWRQLVTKAIYDPKARSLRLTIAQFRQCLTSVSADSGYIEWLADRVIRDRDRAPCYTRLKSIFVSRLSEELKLPRAKVKLPIPAWASS